MNELSIRLLSFFVVFALVAVGETIAPRRGRTVPRTVRWIPNVGLLALNPLLVRIFFPLLPVGAALWAQERQWGFLNLIDAPYAFDLVLTILVLDLAVYLQHVFFHALPLLWRLHMVHMQTLIST